MDLVTRYGETEGRWHPAREGHAAVTLLGHGEWRTSPAGGLYRRLAEELPPIGIAVLRVRCREPASVGECRRDGCAAVEFLRRNGYRRQGMVGHAAGGPVAVQVAAVCGEVRACVLLATQGYGTDEAAELGPRCALLLVHGADDRVMPPHGSAYVHSIAAEPRRIVRVAGGSHTLDEHASLVHAEVRAWLEAAFPRVPASA